MATVPTTKIRVLMTAARRLDVLVAVLNKMKTLFREGEQFTVQLMRGPKQLGGVRSAWRPAYVQLLVLGGAKREAPNQLDISRCRAKKVECTRLRCRCEQCPLRTAQEKAEIAAVLASGTGENTSYDEIPEDDRAGSADEGMPEEVGGEDPAAGGTRQLTRGTPASRPL